MLARLLNQFVHSIFGKRHLKGVSLEMFQELVPSSVLASDFAGALLATQLPYANQAFQGV